MMTKFNDTLGSPSEPPVPSYATALIPTTQGETKVEPEQPVETRRERFKQALHPNCQNVQPRRSDFRKISDWKDV